MFQCRSSPFKNRNRNGSQRYCGLLSWSCFGTGFTSSSFVVSIDSVTRHRRPAGTQGTAGRHPRQAGRHPRQACELRNALEFGDNTTIAVGQGMAALSSFCCGECTGWHQQIYFNVGCNRPGGCQEALYSSWFGCRRQFDDREWCVRNARYRLRGMRAVENVLDSDAPLMRSSEPSVSLLDALEKDLLRPVRRRRARRVCDSGSDAQSRT